MMYYGIDVNDTSVYDAVINTDATTADEVVIEIIAEMEAKRCL
jgi:cytidylate kinase